MDAVGADALDSLDELREALDRRREEKPPAVRILEKLLGLEMKMRQYQLGKAFVDAVVERTGIEGLNKVWERPENLPSLHEIELPEAWISRVV
jgi:putative hydrolase